MAKKSESAPGARHDRKVRLLEADLARATERFRVAKIAAREAKADAKLAKKEMKRNRRALVAAQEQQESKATPTAPVRAKPAPVDTVVSGTKHKAVAPNKRRRIAESPETVRRQRPAKRSVTHRKKAPVTTEKSPPVDGPELQPQLEPVASLPDQRSPDQRS